MEHELKMQDIQHKNTMEMLAAIGAMFGGGGGRGVGGARGGGGGARVGGGGEGGDDGLFEDGNSIDVWDSARH